MTTTARLSSSAVPASVPLTYTIASSTPHSGKYAPENIMADNPQDQSSRWSGAFQGNTTDQWIVLRLESLSVLEKITFGKFSKPHPCNVKEIKVLAGTTEDHMSEVLHVGLKNDTTPETFSLQYVNSAGVCIPTQFIKLMPMLAHGQNFHISIWHIAITGITDSNYVEEVRTRYNEYRETAVLRHVLKHLRQRRLLSPYQTILTRADIQLEHPLVTQLHESLVLRGDWSGSEKLLDVLPSTGLFDEYLQSCQPHAMWTRLLGTDADGDVPPARGGHAMCIDPINEMIYIFGGWDGEKSMDDFWAYSIKEDKWRVLSHSTSQEQNAPGARSCHKMVFDTKTGSIYLLGRLNDADGLRAPAPSNSRTLASTSAGAPSSLPQQQPPSTTTSSSEESTPPNSSFSEFYRYHTRGVDSGKWDFLAFDTASSGGPPLIFDHQMAMDCEAQILYVFGGRVLDGDWDTSKYSGLYSYNVPLSKWRSLQQPEASGTQGHPVIPPRFGHSMVLDPTSKVLYIFAGQREERYLSDMYAYDIKTGVAKEIFSNFSTAGGPDACFTQRAVIDPNLKELYVFCGLTRNTAMGTRNILHAYLSNLSNWVYRYGTRPGKWTQILRQPDRLASEMPLPRFAHQVAYTPFTRSVFLHGGNAGSLNESTKGAGAKGSKDADGDNIESEDGREVSVAGVKERRLDDFWRMELKRPGPEEIIRQAKFQIRRQQFREMCEEVPPIRALNFLQNEVSSVVDHRSAEETEMFRSLLTHLLASPVPVSAHTTGKPSTPSHHNRHPLSHPSDSSISTTTTTLEHEDSRESSSRPRKRSRSNPDEGSEGEVWTSEIAEDYSQGFSDGSSTQRLRDMVDPLEAIIRGGDDCAGMSQLTGARYSQRTEVFEYLLKFIGDSEKQPSDSLLDFVG